MTCYGYSKTLKNTTDLIYWYQRGFNQDYFWIAPTIPRVFAIHKCVREFHQI